MVKFKASVLLLAIASPAIVTATLRSPLFIANNDTRARAQRSSATQASTPTRLSIINDDYERARAEANRRKLHLFVEVWAPW